MIRSLRSRASGLRPQASVKILLVGVALASLSCRGSTSRDTPIFGIRNMYDQPRYDVQEESSFFADHRTMRPLVEGVVSTSEDTDPQIAQGRLDDESGYVLEIPKDVVTRMGGWAALTERGRARYGIYCAPCHDNTGSGEGMVKKRAVASGAAAFVPPTFHQDRIRHMPDGQLFATITNGKSNMPPYAMQIPVNDRWAIVSYVRTLQIAQPKMAAAGSPSAPQTGEHPTQPPPGGSAVAPGGSPSAPQPGEHATQPTGSPSARQAPPGPSGSATHPPEQHK
jgi:hypothetical protein